MTVGRLTPSSAVIVFHTGPDTMLLADGFHRVEAAHRAGRTHVEAEVRAGTRQDVLDYAAVANARHGTADGSWRYGTRSRCPP